MLTVAVISLFVACPWVLIHRVPDFKTGGISACVSDGSLIGILIIPNAEFTTNVGQRAGTKRREALLR